MAGAALEVTGISKRYPGVQALSDISFECRGGAPRRLGDETDPAEHVRGIAARGVRCRNRRSWGGRSMLPIPAAGASPHRTFTRMTRASAR